MKRRIFGIMALALAGAVITTGFAVAGGAPRTAVAYVNPDTGAASENPNVNPDSDCAEPDRSDRQKLSTAGTSGRNVHVDACVFDDEGQEYDGIVTFVSRGRGAVSACPDPDQSVAQIPQVMNGPRLAYVHDHNADGRNDHCHQSGYQMKDAAGDREYHVRLNNDASPGPQRVIFCFDPHQDAMADASGQPAGHGCADTDIKSRVVIRWVR